MMLCGWKISFGSTQLHQPQWHICCWYIKSTCNRQTVCQAYTSPNSKLSSFDYCKMNLLIADTSRRRELHDEIQFHFYPMTLKVILFTFETLLFYLTETPRLFILSSLGFKCCLTFIAQTPCNKRTWARVFKTQISLKIYQSYLLLIHSIHLFYFSRNLTPIQQSRAK